VYDDIGTIVHVSGSEHTC